MASYRNAAALFLLAFVSDVAGSGMMFGGPLLLGHFLLGVALVSLILSILLAIIRFFKGP